MIIDQIYLTWILAVVVFLSIEIISPHLVTLWFALGALVSIIAASLGVSLQGQVALFLGISIILLISLRPVYIKYVKIKKVKTNVDALIGEVGLVTSEINSQEATGLIKVNGQIWSAKSETDDKILKGEKVKILKIAGVKLVVKKM